MRTFNMVIGLLLLANNLAAQTTDKGLAKAMQTLLKDEQLKHASVSLYVAETKTGKPVYGYNEEIGLAPASTQKIFTAIAALETLGEQYRYKTEIGYTGNISNNLLSGNLTITGYGDPTLGSWRFKGRKETCFADSAINMLKKAGIEQITGNISGEGTKFESQTIPGGWIWDDIGNYYGAGACALNWHENQYDLFLKPGARVDDKVSIIKTEPELYGVSLVSEVTTGPAGSGDNGYIYLAPYTHFGYVRGTVPAGPASFVISGSIPNPAHQLILFMEEEMDKQGIPIKRQALENKEKTTTPVNIYTHYSPTLDSIIYWFLQKSINLYGEALLKTVAYEKTGFGSTQKGIEFLNKFWKERGIEESALNIMDGSGLSPQNRVTTKAMVTALQYAKSKSWFKSFYAGLPTYNGMRMKSGSIGGARAYTGYHTSAAGVQYSFAIMVNNYSGSAGAVVQKMYKVLNELK
ncbi:D-alanyl-D-alanine carboxypeptidase/D-alanyl-D-alanine endopeptidase [Foetidibacter luteolus]|uniref:D-alanyl-D-alanine carboxypeptidase/D-alanyl-D-alanine endopeptidase n=1 Tax=Foetidibacter luteolus TaxID=2608880 RepID=UPI00129C07EC|nr:D-alanyl-D-alanine carboxypeptidase/D-alanyl-D-alanine-endopeptidase [Foetidibacter luteolus]